MSGHLFSQGEGLDNEESRNREIHQDQNRAMNTKQKAVIGVGLAVVIAMALYPPGLRGAFRWMTGTYMYSTAGFSDT